VSMRGDSVGESRLLVARVRYMNISGLSVMAFVASFYDRDDFP
jgi:peptidyl-tRNA hydrolase